MEGQEILQEDLLQEVPIIVLLLQCTKKILPGLDREVMGQER
jgi:hypothetical protein